MIKTSDDPLFRYKIKTTPGNEVKFKKEQILYYPDHTCPGCGAAAVANMRGELYHPFTDFGDPRGLGSLSCQAWGAAFGYIQFDCDDHYGEDKGKGIMGYVVEDGESLGGLRVARVGSGMLPLDFVIKPMGNMDCNQLNAERVYQATRFMLAHAAKDKLAEVEDPLTELILKVASGIVPVSRALFVIRSYMELGGKLEEMGGVEVEDGQA